jgi:hypothetical protein
LLRPGPFQEGAGLRQRGIENADHEMIPAARAR